MVWGVPFQILALEVMLFWNLQAQWKRDLNTPLLWGYETLNGGARRLSCHYEPFDKFVGFDISSFDKSLSHVYVDEALNILSSYLDGSFECTPDNPNGDRIFDKDRAVELLRHMYHNMPVFMPDGSKYVRNGRGWPSGLMMTQVVDSLAVSIAVLSVLDRMGFPAVQVRKYFVLGDDTLFIDPRLQIDMERFADLLKTTCGLKLNLKKAWTAPSADHPDFNVLGYNFDGVAPYRDLIQLGAQLMFPERRFDLSNAESVNVMCSRCIGFMYAAAGRSRPFHNACSDIIRYLKPTDMFNINEYDVTGYNKLLQFASLTPDSEPTLEQVYFAVTNLARPEFDSRFYPFWTNTVSYMFGTRVVEWRGSRDSAPASSLQQSVTT
jgi:hypothetical protein